MATIMEARGLKKRYKEVEAVRGVDLSIREGICFGLLGPNGAGKTTTVEMLEGVTAPSEGSILFRGDPLGTTFRERSGLQFQSTALPDYLRVGEALELFRGFYPRGANLEELHELCALKEFLNRDVKKLSGGQRQRVLLAIALVNDPDIVFLDEPTTGLDPQARRNFWDLVLAIKKRGKTVVLTTHYMEEAYVLCDEVAIMDRGLIISQGRPDTLLREHFQGVLVHLDAHAVGPELRARLPEASFERDGSLEIPCKEPSALLAALTEAGVDLSSLRVRSQNLEDLFLTLTGKELRL
jgi:ABC-2 type transport system ATP-binding protein